jgi:NAD+ synthase (glutamine-hydrolysing)
MRIALAQLNYTIGDFDANVGQIKQAISKAVAENVQLILFSELCISGYPPRDFLEFNDFIRKCDEALTEIAKTCTSITAIVGCPTINPKAEGKNLFNSAVVLSGGTRQDEIHKFLLPTYDIFDEYRYFEPERKSHCIEIDGIKIALTICEDLWNIDDDPLYVSAPMEQLISESPKLMINIAASPFDYAHAQARKDVLKENVLKYNLPLIYVNHVGAQTELIFDGGSVALKRDGSIATELNYFETDFRIVEFDENENDILLQESAPALNQTSPLNEAAVDEKSIENIYHALVLGIRDYFAKQNFKKAVLGLSGGIDSALVTVLAADALGKDNVHVILMPSQFSSSGSVDDSVEMVQKLGISYDILPIKSIFDKYLETLKPVFKELPFSVAEENIQARIRGALLMAESNKFGYILLNTSNKSELAVGYGTLYGDMCGGISVIGDVYKTQVYALSKYMNTNGIRIPEAIISKPPSAELRPGQKDSDSLPEYDILDKVLYLYIEKRQGPEEIIAAGFDPALVRRILKLVNTNEYKRYQTPPILRVSSKAFGQGRRLPIVGKYLS